jgi:hypothetical protein
MMTTRIATLMAMATICAPSWAQTPVERVDTEQPLVAITIDDGPHPVNTPKLLELFKKHGVKATVSELLAAAKKPAAPATTKSKGKSVFLTDRAGGKNLWYTHLNTPHAMYHGGKTYLTFHGGGSDYLDPLVVSYDHKTRKVRGPVKVGDNPLAEQADHHGNPALIVDDAGYIHVIYGGHGHHRGEMRHAVSERPHDISAWQHLKNINPQTTYPQLLKMSDGTIYYFYRQGNHRTDWVYVTSRDNGRTFSKEVPVMAAGKKRTDGEYLDGVYYDAWYGSFYKGRGDTIHHVTRYHACANDYSQSYHIERRVHLYHLQLTHGKGEWTNLAGQKLELPVTREQADKHCRVFESRPKTGHGKVIAVRSGGFDVGPKGRVYLVYGHGRGRGGSIDRKWTVAIGDPSSGKWLTHEAPQGGQLTVEKDGSLKLWGDRIAVSQDGGRSWETGAALREQGLSGVALVYNGRPEARVVAHDPRPKDPAGWQNRKIFLWGEEGFITPRSGER